MQAQGDLDAWLGKLEAAVQQAMRKAVRAAAKSRITDSAQVAKHILVASASPACRTIQD